MRSRNEAAVWLANGQTSATAEMTPGMYATHNLSRLGRRELWTKLWNSKPLGVASHFSWTRYVTLPHLLLLHQGYRLSSFRGKNPFSETHLRYIHERDIPICKNSQLRSIPSARNAIYAQSHGHKIPRVRNPMCVPACPRDILFL